MGILMRRLSPTAAVGLGLLSVVMVVFLLGPLGSSRPDGLTKVAQEEGFASAEEDHPLQDAPVAGYRVEGIRDERTSTGTAGAIGVVFTFVLGTVLLKVLRRPRRDEAIVEGDG
jgi:cobalt/nickel transport protein